MTQSGQMGIYFHWPFCLSKCPYCDFNVHVREKIDHERWCAAYLKSIEHYAALLPGRVVRSIYFGGGTPSTMLPETVAAIVDAVRSRWPCVNDLEVTLEANPTSIEVEKFRAFKEAGVSRVSIGVQALNDKDLAFLGRAHSANDALAALETARSVFDRYSFDLIYARPGQTLEDWRTELTRACALAGGHLSLYQLTVERNTPFYFDHEQGRFSIPEEGLAADFYDLTQEVCAVNGLPAYEVSNHAAPGQESAHNLIYWRYGDYVGIGPGAHGRLSLDPDKVATREHHAPDIWLSRVEEGGCAAHPFEALDASARVAEAVMMGLRVAEGLPLSRLENLGGGLWQDWLDESRLTLLAEQGWLSLDAERKYLTLCQGGLLRLNAIVPYILK